MEKVIRKIIHVDMDAFYASVEQLDRPELRGLAIAVGGESSRGVVSAASYEARNFGVKSAMSGIIAKKLCPNLIFVKPRFERYKEISNKKFEPEEENIKQKNVSKKNLKVVVQLIF